MDTQGKGNQKKAAIIALAVLVVVIVGALVAYRALTADEPDSSAAAAEPYATVSQAASSASSTASFASAASDVSLSSDGPSAASASDAASSPSSAGTSSAPSGASASPSNDASSSEALACEIFENDGNPVMIADVSQGKPTVVNIWATWCPYCVDEMDDFQTLFDEYGDKVQFIMLNACDTSQEVAESRSYIKEHGYTFPVYYDASHAFQILYSVRALPTTVILDADGNTLLERPGRIEAARMEATIAAL